MTSIVSLKHISKSYGGHGTSDNQQIFLDFNLEIVAGEFLVIMGKSGLGKSTLLNIIGGLTDFEGQRETDIQFFPFVFQEESNLLPWKTVVGHLKWIHPHIEEEYLSQLVEKLQLTGAENKKPGQLSGGMKQRLKLAMALAKPAEILLMDEPFTGLDEDLRKQMWDMLKNLKKDFGLTMVLVTHDSREAEALGDRILHL